MSWIEVMPNGDSRAHWRTDDGKRHTKRFHYADDAEALLADLKNTVDQDEEGR
ncbi:hypothetical protein [Nocardiopsis salina]|uniref:hypothetical protein n=1 Tax=Nocardiopsis salina TaxID=245836 RepID=UPI001378ECA2|nr:hypothetical protein [Nocardiopsis salina]